MKIGILTQKLENNYGGILQNYALQTVLRQLGHKPLTIDFRPGSSKFWYMVSQMRIVVEKCLGKQVRFQKYSSRERSPLTSSFVKKYIKTTKRIEVLTPLTSIFYCFDAVIVGSDQVWRPKYNVLRNTYLSFVRGNCTKIAYAASFGVSEWEYNDQQTELCKKWIAPFKGVSVREHSGIDLCDRFLNKSAAHVLDPTMLLDCSHYTTLCQNVSNISKEPYLFAYVLDLNSEKKELIESYARKKNLKVQMLSAEDNITESIEYWLASIRDADFVITDSFHGTVFSILFKKLFVSLVNTNRGADRFYSLLNMFGLQNRICDSFTSDSIQKTSDGEIDWEKVNTILVKMRIYSIKFITDNLNK